MRKDSCQVTVGVDVTGIDASITVRVWKREWRGLLPSPLCFLSRRCLPFRTCCFRASLHVHSFEGNSCVPVLLFDCHQVARVAH